PPRPPPPSAGQGPEQDTDSSVRAAPSTAEGPGVNGGSVGAGAGGGPADQAPAGDGGGSGPANDAIPDPADGVTIMSSGVGGVGGGGGAAGPLELFLARGEKLPVVLLTCDRHELLEETIKSLRNVRGMDMSTVMVLQDGTNDKVAAVVREQNLYLKQNTQAPGLRGGPKPGDNGAKRIAMHYKFALQYAFERRPQAPAVVIVEDDLLFSPDFLEYLETNAPVLERDPTTLVLSAWNDNGYAGRVSDKAELKRTQYFPGLGWLLTRKLFDELGPKWPREHWDHWLRDPKQHQGRECVYPEVPRTYHNGVRGTFMDQAMHDRLFKNIWHNQDASFSWKSAQGGGGGGGSPPGYAKSMTKNYERRMEARIASARHINNLNDLPTSSTPQENEQLVMWYTLQQTEEPPARRGGKPNPHPFKPLSDVFGIWHEYRRGEHSGMHSLRYWDAHVMLINAAKSPYVKFKPDGLVPAPMNALRGELSHVGPLVKTPAERAAMSCDDVCAAKA
ncbi:unnamed protein product, partial [Ectocarpus sp. 4 AP-2014]